MDFLSQGYALFYAPFYLGAILSGRSIQSPFETVLPQLTA